MTLVQKTRQATCEWQFCARAKSDKPQRHFTGPADHW
jgi:hypothetical protein